MIDVDGYNRCGPHSEFYGTMGIPEATLHIPGLSRETVERRKPDATTENSPWGPHALSNISTSSGRSDDEEGDDECGAVTIPPSRERLSYTRYQLELLNGIYVKVRYPNKIQKQLIAKRVGITKDQVKIWFQNRRRKDVVGSCKSTDSSESSESSCDNGKSNDTKSDGDSSSTNQSEMDMVPKVVLKSIVSELEKFEKDYIKTQQTKKKRRQRKTVSKQSLGEKLALTCGLDMVSPPNQITPSASQQKLLVNHFNHSQKTSVFENPRDLTRPTPHIIPFPGNSVGPVDGTTLYQSEINKTTLYADRVTLDKPSLNFDSLPVLSDLLGYRATMAQQREELIRNSANSAFLFQRMQYQTLHGLASTSSHLGHNRIFPFPIVAESPVLLSSLRQNEQNLNNTPYQQSEASTSAHRPLVISSLPNTYHSSSIWHGQSNPTEPGTFSQT